MRPSESLAMKPLDGWNMLEWYCGGGGDSDKRISGLPLYCADQKPHARSINSHQPFGVQFASKLQSIDMNRSIVPELPRHLHVLKSTSQSLSTTPWSFSCLLCFGRAMVEVGRNCHNCSDRWSLGFHWFPLVSIGFHWFPLLWSRECIWFQYDRLSASFCPVARHVRVAEEINTSGSGRITWEVQLGAPDG